MTITQKMFMGTASVALLSALSIMPLVASANEGEKDKTIVRPIQSGVEVAITNDGHVLVRGAKVTAISGSTITAQTVWGATTMNWTVNAGSAQFVNVNGSDSTLGSISIGDSVSFAGSWNPSGAALNVNASVVKDRSVGSRTVTVTGKVSSINAGATSLVLAKGENNDKTITVQFNGSTVINLNDATATFNSIQTGDTIKVKGTANADATILTATNVSIVRPALSKDERNFNQRVKAWLSNRGLNFFGGAEIK